MCCYGLCCALRFLGRQTDDKHVLQVFHFSESKDKTETDNADGSDAVQPEQETQNGLHTQSNSKKAS